MICWVLVPGTCITHVDMLFSAGILLKQERLLTIKAIMLLFGADIRREGNQKIK